ncbi:hypothetical protein CQW23_19371 [Capsicum baccatum]|uniref:Uncharacterized protein n=1 Tax=Capsicum baccatum TaxID=33114 RepID=A0A2G2W5L7_CAPBA|nr:hypothetical protein CQW23_19371 [Capsicum baccatum]
MKGILQLYTTSSSEVASVLLELMLRMIDSSNLPGNVLTIHETIEMNTAYNHWKPKKGKKRQLDALKLSLCAMSGKESHHKPYLAFLLETSESFLLSREEGPFLREAQKLELLKLRVVEGNPQMVGED